MTQSLSPNAIPPAFPDHTQLPDSDGTLALGIDFGTSGARAIALTAAQDIAFTDRIAFAPNAPDLAQLWQQTLYQLLSRLPPPLAAELSAIALNGTSGTVLLCDRQGTPLAPPLLYNETRQPQRPPKDWSGEGLPTPDLPPTFNKLLWWAEQFRWQSPPADCYLLHQADWLAYQLHGRIGFSDYHNALKLGYDPGTLAYPDWMRASVYAPLLPQVVAPGTPLGPVTPAIAQRFGLNPHCQICAGTTDSIAAFFAAGVCTPGQAVTSLGSTLVLKLLSTVRIDEPSYGIYSHRFESPGNDPLWLVGGASNTGGAVLRQFFDDATLQTLSDRLTPSQPTGLDYYPLLRPGERFPIADPQLAPRLDPRPTDDTRFLQGLLESMARIEALGYERLQTLGATPLRHVWTAGGGAQNQAWTQIRSRSLGVPIQPAAQQEAAYGSARLALSTGRFSNRAID